MSDETTFTPLSPEDASKVKKQIEFYFSDSSYPKDKFLLETAKQNKDGFVPIEVLTTFNRLKAITTNIDQIQDALKDSDGLFPFYIQFLNIHDHHFSCYFE